MKKKIGLYLQYPWKFPDSPYYKYLVENAPEGIRFFNGEKQRGVITSQGKFWISNFLKRNIRGALNSLNLAIPNAHLSPEGDYDLIHCAHCLSKNKDKPWVADIESWWSFYISGQNSKIASEKVRKILMHPKCKRIMPWTEATKRDILKRFPEIEEKMEVVYPAVPEAKGTRKEKTKVRRVIFVARYFWNKCGAWAIYAFKKLKKRFPEVEFVIVTEAKINEKVEGIVILPLMSQKDLFELFEESDILFYPSMGDTFGFQILEAMSYGIPTVSVINSNVMSRKEIIQNGYNGFLIDSQLGLDRSSVGEPEKKVINKMIDKTSRIIEDPEVQKRMSKNCLEEISSGRFSIKRRNEKLKEIYEEAVK